MWLLRPARVHIHLSQWCVPACPCGTVCVPASGGDGSHARGCGGCCLPLSAFAGSLSAGQGTRCVSVSIRRVSPCRILACMAPGAGSLNRSFPRPVSMAAVAAAARHHRPIPFFPFRQTVANCACYCLVRASRSACPWPPSAHCYAGRLGSSWRTRNSSIGRSLR